MFGIGFGELVVIVIVLIIAVGPDKLPGFLKTIGRTVRQVRGAATELREASGIDDLLDHQDLKELSDLRRPADVLKKATRPGTPPSRSPLNEAAREKESPADGIDSVVSTTGLIKPSTTEVAAVSKDSAPS